MKKPTVAIVGRMNVGKSTLFNRLTETQKAIISSWAGTTRDVNYGTVIWNGKEMDFLDTGGMDVEDDEQLEDRVIAAAERAMNEADVVLFVIDGQVGLMPQDKKLWKVIQASGRPVVLVVNKIDSQKVEFAIPGNVHQVSADETVTISAKSGRNSDELLDIVFGMVEKLPDVEEEDPRTKVAIVGRPNVGKSSFLNAILGEDRVIVADKAHTTRDTNDIPYEYKGREFVLIDTAGMRKKSRVGEKWEDRRLGDIEKQSVHGAVEAMKRADVVLFVIEAQKSISQQDKKIAHLADKYGKGLIIVVNKWDLIEEKDSTTINEFSEYFDAALPFLRWAPMVFTSATDGLRVRETLDVVLKVTENYERVIPQVHLEKAMNHAASMYNPRPTKMRKYRRKFAKFLTFKQVSTRPPRFYLRAKNFEDIPAALINVIENDLRDTFDFEGVKLNIEVSDKEGFPSAEVERRARKIRSEEVQAEKAAAALEAEEVEVLETEELTGEDFEAVTTSEERVTESTETYDTEE